MTLRKIIEIDEAKCNGCGLCVPNCPEGALQVIDGKARLVGDLLCDGLGACIGNCPEGAINVVEREAEPYDERKVMENVASQGANVIRAHLKHLRDHGQMDFLMEAMAFLREKGIPVPEGFPAESGNGSCNHGHSEQQPRAAHHAHGGASGGCPGGKIMDFRQAETSEAEPCGRQPSALRQWPVQMHLISPAAPYFKKSDLLLAADCTAFAVGGFHQDFLKGKSLVIACPKLDQGREVYVEKLRALVDEAQINTLTIMVMEVPCCSGLLTLAAEALSRTGRKVPVKKIVVSLRGEILSEEWASL
ncbi:MAG TPA: 4Fe-4S binding protein [Candidatus Sumerlaeota bacterium]|nr:4Fe-4S binding protein [Candidatus Sumerlaeota bacterium]